MPDPEIRNVVVPGIEHPAIPGVAAAARTAVQEYRWPGAGRAYFFSINPMAVAGIQQTLVTGELW